MAPRVLPLEARQAAWNLVWRRLLRDPEAQDPDAEPTSATPDSVSVPAAEDEDPYRVPDTGLTEAIERPAT